MQRVFLSWSFPRHGWYKINVDGERNKRMAGGGVIRDQHGQWVGGFSANYGNGQSIDAELSAFLTGLEFAWRSGWHPLEVETDAIKVVMFMVNENEVDSGHPQFEMVRKCQAALEKQWRYQLCHVYREQNCVADAFASHGLTLDPGCYYFTELPPHCLPFLDEDRRWFTRPRLLLPKLCNIGLF